MKSFDELYQNYIERSKNYKVADYSKSTICEYLFICSIFNINNEYSGYNTLGSYKKLYEIGIKSYYSPLLENLKFNKTSWKLIVDTMKIQKKKFKNDFPRTI